MVYLSLGSNLGDRFAHLQLAIGLIRYRVGKITAISSLYETPAWGFESTPFYNLCLAVETSLSAEEVLKATLEIETYLGRERLPEKENYQARTIDIDLLFYADLEMNTPALELPHPRLHLRNFILIPLVEIAPNLVHPTFKKTIVQLAEESPDEDEINRLEQAMKQPKHHQFIAIEGNIGAGKTSCMHLLQEALGGTVLAENFFNNPYLEDFYKNPKAFALQVETAFLNDRVAQYQQIFKEEVKRPIISDYTLEKSKLFAQENLQQEDLRRYLELHQAKTKTFPQPSVLLFLDQSIDDLLKNIQARGRSFEKKIDPVYLKKLEEQYRLWKKETATPLLNIDCQDLDFVKKKSDFLHLLLRFFQF